MLSGIICPHILLLIISEIQVSLPKASKFCPPIHAEWASQVALVVKILPASAGDVRDADSFPGLGRSPEGEHGNPRQYSCLENPMDRGAWRGCSPYGHTESDTTEAT